MRCPVFKLLKCIAASVAIFLSPSLADGAGIGEQKADEHMANPFSGARFYRDADYVDSVLAVANMQSGALGRQIREVAKYPTFVWLDCIAAVNGAKGNQRGLAGHLDKALEQGANALGVV